MEKISFTPLVIHLEEQTEAYNLLCRQYELQHGAPDAALITGWTVEVIEPVIRAVGDDHKERIPQVFKALFTEMLRLMGNGCLQEFEKEYRQAWSLYSKVTTLLSLYPERIVHAFSQAIGSIREHQPGKTLDWIERMGGVITECSTVEEILECGRILAWSCGMAHLRNRAASSFKNLNSVLQNQVQKILSTQVALEESFLKPWPQLTQPAFMGVAGGFTGYGGVFTATPIVVLAGNLIIASDPHHAYVLFADQFGKVLLPAGAMDQQEIAGLVSKPGCNDFRRQFGRLFEFDDITSCIVQDQTLVLTRSSSHYLYIYGCQS